MTLEELKQENHWLKKQNELLRNIINNNVISLPERVVERMKKPTSELTERV